MLGDWRLEIIRIVWQHCCFPAFGQSYLRLAGVSPIKYIRQLRDLIFVVLLDHAISLQLLQGLFRYVFLIQPGIRWGRTADSLLVRHRQRSRVTNQRREVGALVGLAIARRIMR